MSDIDVRRHYKHKYRKYKAKYESLLKQTGGLNFHQNLEILTLNDLEKEYRSVYLFLYDLPDMGVEDDEYDTLQQQFSSYLARLENELRNRTGGEAAIRRARRVGPGGAYY